MIEKCEFDEPQSDFEDIEPEAVTALESVLGKPIIVSEQRKAQKVAEYKQLAVDTRKLSARQRLYLRYLLASQMRPAVAIRAMAKNMDIEPLKEGTIREWHRRNDFRAIVSRYTQLMLDVSGVGSPAQTLLRIDAVVEDALTPVPMYHNGKALVNPETGQVQKEVDRGSALKGLEMIGKAAGMFRKDEENSQRVTVVLDFSGEAPVGEQESEIIEGEATEIGQ